MTDNSIHGQRAVRVAALLLWAGALLWLSLDTQPVSLPGRVMSWDKLQHAAAYALLTWLAGRAFLLFAATPLRAWRWALLVAVAFGALLELLQEVMSPVRRAEWGDLAADALGAVAVWAVFRRCGKGSAGGKGGA